MIMRYLIIRRLLQADPRQLVLIKVAYKKLDGDKKRVQILKLFQYYLKKKLVLLCWSASSLISNNE